MKRLFRPTLARRILITTLFSFVFGFIVLAAFSFYQLFKNQDGAVDVNRKVFVESLSKSLSRYETDEQLRTSAEAVQNMVEAQMRQAQQPIGAHIQVWQRSGQRIYTSLSLPEQRPTTLSSADTFDWDGQHYSVTSLSSPRFIVDLLSSVTLQSEYQLIIRVLSDLSLKMAIAFPLLLLPIWFAVHSGLRPLGSLSNSLRQRPVDDLTPFASDMRYEELQPVVQAINDLMERLRHKIKQEQSFIHDAAHELQTPLAVIANQTHVLAAAKTIEERSEAHQNAEHAIERAGHLVRQMVALARLDSDRHDDLKALDVATEVRNILAPLVPSAQVKSIKLTLDSPDSAPLYGDTGALNSIVTNLIDNALRYTSEGGHVQVEIVSGDGEITLCVRDDGSGISIADRELVFERYYRVAGTGVSGSGLGLAIVKQAVARMRGTIRLEGEGLQGKGCAFVVKLPKRR